MTMSRRGIARLYLLQRRKKVVMNVRSGRECSHSFCSFYLNLFVVLETSSIGSLVQEDVDVLCFVTYLLFVIL